MQLERYVMFSPSTRQGIMSTYTVLVLVLVLVPGQWLPVIYCKLQGPKLKYILESGVGAKVSSWLLKLGPVPLA